ASDASDASPLEPSGVAAASLDASLDASAVAPSPVAPSGTVASSPEPSAAWPPSPGDASTEASVSDRPSVIPSLDGEEESDDAASDRPGSSDVPGPGDPLPPEPLHATRTADEMTHVHANCTRIGRTSVVIVSSIRFLEGAGVSAPSRLHRPDVRLGRVRAD